MESRLAAASVSFVTRRPPELGAFAMEWALAFVTPFVTSQNPRPGDVGKTLIPLGGIGGWWLGAELNRRHKDFQSSALPTELPSQPT